LVPVAKARLDRLCDLRHLGHGRTPGHRASLPVGLAHGHGGMVVCGCPGGGDGWPRMGDRCRPRPGGGHSGPWPLCHEPVRGNPWLGAGRGHARGPHVHSRTQGGTHGRPAPGRPEWWCGPRAPGRGLAARLTSCGDPPGHGGPGNCGCPRCWRRGGGCLAPEPQASYPQSGSNRGAIFRLASPAPAWPPWALRGHRPHLAGRRLARPMPQITCSPSAS
jgi:hypothetical protein